MNIADIFKMVKSDLKKDQLKQLSKDNFYEFFNLTIKNIKTYDELKVLFENNNLNIDNIYFCENHLYNTWYIDEPAYVQLNGLIDIEMIKSINDYKLRLLSLIDNNDYIKLMTIINDVFKVDYFLNNYENIPNDQKEKILDDIYTSREYVLNAIDVDLIKQTFNGYRVQEMISDHNITDDYINIYRGQTIESTPLQKSLSWTLSKDTAKWFANRFNSNGVVYQGKVHIKNILMYTNDRSENEVLVDFKDILELKKCN